MSLRRTADPEVARFYGAVDLRARRHRPVPYPGGARRRTPQTDLLVARRSRGAARRGLGPAAARARRHQPQAAAPAIPRAGAQDAGEPIRHGVGAADRAPFRSCRRRQVPRGSPKCPRRWRPRKRATDESWPRCVRRHRGRPDRRVGGSSPRQRRWRASGPRCSASTTGWSPTSRS